MGLAAPRRAALAGLAALAALAPVAAQDVLAPARVTLHPGAAPGDTLERTAEQRGARQVERTTIVAREGDGFVIERLGPAWPGAALRLVVDAAGRTRSAQLGPITGAAAGALRPIGVADDAPAEDEGEVAAGEEDVVTPAGTFRCQKRTFERRDPFPTRNARWLVAAGPRRGLLVRQVTEAGGRTTTLELLAVEDAVERIGDLEVPCIHATRRASLDGVPSPPVEEWVATRPLLFGETLVRLENGLGSTRITAIAHDGASAFPPPRRD